MIANTVYYGENQVVRKTTNHGTLAKDLEPFGNAKPIKTMYRLGYSPICFII